MTPTRNGSFTLRCALVAGPLLLSLALAWLVTGPVSLGGGEKDILLVLPLVLWSFLYLCAGLALWWRGMALGRALAWSAGVALGGVVVVIAGLFFALQPGTTGADQPRASQAVSPNPAL